MSKTVLFLGDSITDCRRRRDNPSDLGMGFAPCVKFDFSHGEDLVFYNKGVSGDRICHIRARLKEDLLDLKPDVLVLFAGVNEVIVQIYEKFLTPHDEFLRDFRFVLDSVKKDLPQTKIIMIQPFMFGCSEELKPLLMHLEPIKKYIGELAREYADEFIPLSEIYSRVIQDGFPDFTIAEDGVHPTPFGYHILTKEITEKIRKFITEERKC